MNNTETGKWDRIFPYAPVGGIQLIWCVMGLFNSNKSVRFHAIQSLIYWPSVAASLFLPIWEIIRSFTSYEFAMVAMIGYAAFAGFALPIYIMWRLWSGQDVVFPIIGAPIASLCGVELKDFKKIKKRLRNACL